MYKTNCIQAAVCLFYLCRCRSRLITDKILSWYSLCVCVCVCLLLVLVMLASLLARPVYANLLLGGLSGVVSLFYFSSPAQATRSKVKVKFKVKMEKCDCYWKSQGFTSLIPLWIWSETFIALKPSFAFIARPFPDKGWHHVTMCLPAGFSFCKPYMCDVDREVLNVKVYCRSTGVKLQGVFTTLWIKKKSPQLLVLLQKYIPAYTTTCIYCFLLV